MQIKTELSAFLQELHDDVLSRIPTEADLSGTAAEIAFTELVAEELAEYGAIDDIIPCLLDVKTAKGIIRTHGYYVSEERDRLDLFVTVYRNANDGDTITQTDVRQGYERAKRILQLIDDGWDIGDPDQSDQATMIEAIREAAASIRESRVFIITDCVARDTNEVKEIFCERDVRCVIWDATRLLRIRNSGKAYESIEIDISQLCPGGLPCLAMPDRDCGYRTFLTLIPATVLYQLYAEYKSRLMQLNVRSFLSVRKKTNTGIRKTILNTPSRFLAYNNGITATVESIEVECAPDGQTVIKRVKGLQIVNGGQTVVSIHHAAANDKAPLDEIFVQAKISVVDTDLMKEFVPLISRFANTQNPINEADFSSNDPFHVSLEELSERFWTPGERSRWFYERARGQYQVAKSLASTTPAKAAKFKTDVPTTQKFSKTDLAKYVNSWSQNPDIVSRGAQKNFTTFMDEIARNGSNLELNEETYKRFIAQAIIFKKAESIARSLKLPAYRANAVTYTVALLSYLTQHRVDLDAIWSKQTISESLTRTLEQLMPLVTQELISSAKGKNVTEWCKKLDCWRHIQMMNISLSSELDAELLPGVRPTVGRDAKVKDLELTAEDRDNLAAVMLIPDSAWLDIHRWAVKSGTVPEFQCGIAHTLIGYAAGGWAKVPSRKQARYAVEILEMARGHVPSYDRFLRGSDE